MYTYIYIYTLNSNNPSPTQATKPETICIGKTFLERIFFSRGRYAEILGCMVIEPVIGYIYIYIDIYKFIHVYIYIICSYIISIT